MINITDENVLDFQKGFLCPQCGKPTNTYRHLWAKIWCEHCGLTLQEEGDKITFYDYKKFIKTEEVKMAEQTDKVDELLGATKKDPILYDSKKYPKEGFRYVITKSSSNGKYLIGTPMSIERKRKDDKKLTVFFMCRVGKKLGSNDVRYFDSVHRLVEDLGGAEWTLDLRWARERIDEYEQEIKELNKDYFGAEDE